MIQSDRPVVISAPEPRELPLIFNDADLATLTERYDVVETTADALCNLDDGVLSQARYIIGQPPIPAETLGRLASLRAVFNVESNLIDNMPYEEVFARGIHVLTTGSVFAVPVAEIGLGFALDLARGISSAQSDFQNGTEKWGGDGNQRARLLSGAAVGIVGYGDLGKALHRLLAGFRCRIMVHDPWLPNSVLQDHLVRPASLDEVMEGSDYVFVMSAVTSENRKGLGPAEFARMRPGAAFILLSRADVVDFDAMLDAVERGHILAASDVFPTEPLPRDHRARGLKGFLGSGHRAGAMDVAFKQMGQMVLDDMALLDRGLPPQRCKRAERETASRFRSKAVERN